MNTPRRNLSLTGGTRFTFPKEIFNDTKGDRSDVPNVAILITDGVPNLDVDQLSGEVDIIKSLDIRIVGVGVTKGVRFLTVSPACTATVTFSVYMLAVQLHR